jgi:hypothetical protein
MSDVICISYTPPQDYADAVRRQRRIVRERGCGATSGDSFWRGLGTYDEIDPYARYRTEERKPITCPGWRAMVDKAKREIAKSESMNRVIEMAARVQPSVVKAFLKALNNGKS